MEVENYFEIVEAGKSAKVSTVEGICLDFFNIALTPSKDQSNAVSVHMIIGQKKVLLCVLNEKAGIYQIKTNIEIGEENVIFEVRGKGTVTFSGVTYRTDLDEESFGEEEMSEEDSE